MKLNKNEDRSVRRGTLNPYKNDECLTAKGKRNCS